MFSSLKYTNAYSTVIYRLNRMKIYFQELLLFADNSFCIFKEQSNAII